MNAFRCDYCGKFIAYAELDRATSECYMVTPDSEVSVETYATHHNSCKEKDDERRTKISCRKTS